MQNRMGIFRDLLSSRVTLATVALVAAYWAYTHYGDIKRIEYSTTQGGIAVQEPFHGDPAGLSVETPVNKEGKIEVYLTHSESETKHSVYGDLLPETSRTLELIVERARTNRIPQEERKEAFRHAAALLQILYEQEVR